MQRPPFIGYQQGRFAKRPYYFGPRASSRQAQCRPCPLDELWLTPDLSLNYPPSQGYTLRIQMDTMARDSGAGR